MSDDESAAGKLASVASTDAGRGPAWLITMQSKINNLRDRVELAFGRKDKTQEYYFWMGHLKQYDEFFKTKAGIRVAERAETDRSNKRIKPFVDAVDAATSLWETRLQPKHIHGPDTFLDAECRLACSFYLILCIVSRQREVWYIPSALKDWQYMNETRSEEQQALKDQHKHREKDILFWFRFFGSQNEVFLEDFIRSLQLHIVIVENQTLGVEEDVFTNMVKSTVLGTDKGMVDRRNWLNFVKRFGPTLKDVLLHLKGVTSYSDGSLSPWLNFKFNEIDCVEHIQPPPPPKDTGPAGADDGDSGDEFDEFEEVEQDQPDAKPNFIIRLSRDKENFVMHYVEAKRVRRRIVRDVGPACKIYLTEGGYFVQSTTEEKKFPTLREAMLDVCAKFRYRKEKRLLDSELEQWQAATRAGPQPNLSSLLFESQQVRLKVLDILDEEQFKSEQKFITSQNDLQRLTSHSGGGGGGGGMQSFNSVDMEEGVAVQVVVESEGEGRGVKPLKMHTSEQTERRRISLINFHLVFLFLDRDRSGLLESDEVRTGLFMVLKHSLLEVAEVFHLTEAFEENLLTSWLPTESMEGINKEQFKGVFATTIGKMYKAARKDQMSEEGQLLVAEVKEQDEQRKIKGLKTKFRELTQEHFLHIIFNTCDEVAQHCGLIKSSAIAEEQKRSRLQLHLFITYLAFPLVFVHSYIWKQKVIPNKIAQWKKKTRSPTIHRGLAACCENKSKSKWRSRCQFVGKLIASLLIVIVTAVFYYSPLASLVLFLVSVSKVTVLEAIIPLVAVLVTGIVFVVGQRLQVKLSKQYAEEEWLMAHLRVKQARVKPCRLDTTLDIPFDGVRILDGAEAGVFQLEFRMMAPLEKGNVFHAKQTLERLLQSMEVNHDDGGGGGGGGGRLTMDRSPGSELGKMKSQQQSSHLDSARQARATISGAPGGKKWQVKNRFAPVPTPRGMAVLVYPDGTSLKELEEAMKKKIPLRPKEDDDDGSMFARELGGDDLAVDYKPLNDAIPMPEPLKELGVTEITLRRIPAWGIREQRLYAAQRKEKRTRSFLQAVRAYYWSNRRRGTTALILTVLVSFVHVLLPGFTRLKDGPVAFIASTAPQDIFIAAVFMVCSFPGVIMMLFFLQAATFHYYDLRTCLCAVIDLTDPKAAATQHFSHFLPLNAAVNVEYWSLLRQYAKRKADRSMNTVIATTLIIMVLLMGSAFLRVIVYQIKTFDGFYVLALFDVLVLAGHLVQLIIVLVALNTKVQLGSLECLERAKLKISIECDKLQELLKKAKETQQAEAKGEQNQKDAEGTTRDQDEDEEVDSSQKPESIQEDLEARKANYTILESSLSVMKTIDEPIKILGLTVDQAFLTQMLGLLGAGLGSTLFTFIDGGRPRVVITSNTTSMI